MGASRLFRLRVLGIAAAVMVAGAAPLRADMLAQAECQKIDAERRALMVLGVDKYIEKGADWAKANLTVADLDLVKRYFHLFEQLKFRCEEDIGITEIDEPDTVDGDDAPQTASRAGAAPAPAAAAAQGSAVQSPAAPGSVPAKTGRPAAAPERQTKPSGGQSSAAAVPTYTGSTTTTFEKAVDTNTTSIAKRPRQAQ